MSVASYINYHRKPFQQFVSISNYNERHGTNIPENQAFESAFQSALADARRVTDPHDYIQHHFNVEKMSLRNMGGYPSAHSTRNFINPNYDRVGGNGHGCHSNSSKHSKDTIHHAVENSIEKARMRAKAEHDKAIEDIDFNMAAKRARAERRRNAERASSGYSSSRGSSRRSSSSRVSTDDWRNVFRADARAYLSDDKGNFQEVAIKGYKKDDKGTYIEVEMPTSGITGAFKRAWRSVWGSSNTINIYEEDRARIKTESEHFVAEKEAAAELAENEAKLAEKKLTELQAQEKESGLLTSESLESSDEDEKKSDDEEESGEKGEKSNDEEGEESDNEENAYLSKKAKKRQDAENLKKQRKNTEDLKKQKAEAKAKAEKQKAEANKALQAEKKKKKAMEHLDKLMTYSEDPDEIAEGIQNALDNGIDKDAKIMKEANDQVVALNVLIDAVNSSEDPEEINEKIDKAIKDNVKEDGQLVRSAVDKVTRIGRERIRKQKEEEEKQGGRMSMEEKKRLSDERTKKKLAAVPKNELTLEDFKPDDTPVSKEGYLTWLARKTLWGGPDPEGKKDVRNIAYVLVKEAGIRNIEQFTSKKEKENYLKYKEVIDKYLETFGYPIYSWNNAVDPITIMFTFLSQLPSVEKTQKQNAKKGNYQIGVGVGRLRLNEIKTPEQLFAEVDRVLNYYKRDNENKQTWMKAVNEYDKKYKTVKERKGLLEKAKNRAKNFRKENNISDSQEQQYATMFNKAYKKHAPQLNDPDAFDDLDAALEGEYDEVVDAPVAKPRASIVSAKPPAVENAKPPVDNVDKAPTLHEEIDAYLRTSAKDESAFDRDRAHVVHFNTSSMNLPSRLMKGRDRYMQRLRAYVDGDTSVKVRMMDNKEVLVSSLKPDMASLKKMLKASSGAPRFCECD